MKPCSCCRTPRSCPPASPSAVAKPTYSKHTPISPACQIARYNTRLAENDIRISRADYLPSLAIHAGNTLSRPLTSTMDDMFANNWNVALSLSYSLSSLYRNKHKMHEARQYVASGRNAEKQMMRRYASMCAAPISATRKRSTG